MLQNFMTPFKPEQEDQNQSKQVMKRKKKVNNNNNNNNNYQKKNYCSSNLEAEGRRRSKSGLCQSRNMGMDVNNMIGLRLVTQITNSSSHTKPNINVVLKSPNILTKLGNSTSSSSSSSSMEMCFLNTCNLCNKKLSHDKDIYMYRGDQGFCSIECRKRQIVMDEMKEAEGRNSNYRNCWNDARRRETRLILEDLRLHRIQSNSPHRQNHWAIVS